MITLDLKVINCTCILYFFLKFLHSVCIVKTVQHHFLLQFPLVFWILCIIKIYCQKHVHKSVLTLAYSSHCHRVFVTAGIRIDGFITACHM